MRFIRRIIGYIQGKGIGAESIRYIIVGVLTTLINIGLYGLMLEIMNIDVTISNVTSIIVAIIFAYLANKLVVFRRHSDSLKALALEFCKFVGSRLITMALEVGFVYMFHNILGYSEWIGKYVAMILVILINYILSKVIVFNNTGKNAVSGQDSPVSGQDLEINGNTPADSSENPIVESAKLSDTDPSTKSEGTIEGTDT